MTNDLKNHYRRLFQEHNYSPLAVQHRSKAEQCRRFSIVTAPLEPSHSVVDVGCGFGDMATYLRQNGHTGRYLGLDFVPEFIAKAKELHAHHVDCEFREFDLRSEAIPDNFDYAIVSGTFNNKLAGDDNLNMLLGTLNMLFGRVTVGVVFNALSTHVEYMDDNLFYVEPEYLFNHCKQLTKYVSLKHDYVLREGGYPYEFTMFLAKEPANTMAARRQAGEAFEKAR